MDTPNTPFADVQVADDAPLLNEARRLHDTMKTLYPGTSFGMMSALEAVFKLGKFLDKRGVFAAMDLKHSIK